MALRYEEPSKPGERSLLQKLGKSAFYFYKGTQLLPQVLLCALCHAAQVADILRKVARTSIRRALRYADRETLLRVWGAPAGQLYLAAGLEFQLQEGFCAPATQRILLRSVGVSASLIPAQCRSPSVPAVVAQQLDAQSLGVTRSSVVYGDQGIDAFRAALKLVNDPRYRVCVNFLRVALFGFPMVLNPMFFTFYGGHFSPVVGYLDNEDLVAVFDVNHNYGPFLVSTQRLFDAVNTFDISSKSYRGLVVTEVCSV